MLLPALLTACTVTDGDTIRCGQERIRLLAIDAPETKGHCRRGRTCAPGNPIAARETLIRAMASGPLTIIRQGRDRYGRTLGWVMAGSVDLSCAQLAAGSAIYKPKWDPGSRLATTCRFAFNR
jgi:micrococcal nuclease